MKKFLCVLLCFIFFAGCKGEKNPTAVNRNIAYRAHIFYYGEEYDCLVTVKNDGSAEYVIKDGDMDGFCALFCGDTVSYSYQGKESTSPVLYGKGMFAVLFDMNKKSGGCIAENEGGDCIIRGSTAIGEFSLFVSGAGLPLYAELDGKDFYVDFYDVSIAKDS